MKKDEEFLKLKKYSRYTNVSKPQFKLYKALKEKDIHVVLEHPIRGGLSVDIAYLEDDKKIAIECDGDFWHVNKERYKTPTPRQKRKRQKDHVRDFILKKKGWTIIRIWASRIDDDINSCIQEIEEVILHG